MIQVIVGMAAAMVAAVAVFALIGQVYDAFKRLADAEAVAAQAIERIAALESQQKEDAALLASLDRSLGELHSFVTRPRPAQPKVAEPTIAKNWRDFQTIMQQVDE